MEEEKRRFRWFVVIVSHYKKSQLREKVPDTPYGLRQGSKLPSRYRDDETEAGISRHRSPRNKTPRKFDSLTAQLKYVISD